MSVRIAIVGRPNVGKSSLLNLLAKEMASIVDPTPGVTRDRVERTVWLEPPNGQGPLKRADAVDTGGLGVYVADGARYDDAGQDLARLTERIEAQIDFAVGEADVVLFVIDAREGVTALDGLVAERLRRSAADRETLSRVRVVANKVDAQKWEAHALECAELGFGEPLMVSAKTRYLRREFLDALYELTPTPPTTPETSAGETGQSAPEMKLAVVGKRNAGKSTLINTLAGQERVIVSEIAGATRDAIDIRFTFEGRSCLAIDTAGLRRRTSMGTRVEVWARERAYASIERADVTLLLIDATQEVSHVEKRLAQHIDERFKPCVIVVNKWDLVQGRVGPKGQPVTPDDYRKYLDDRLKGLARSPIVFMSAKEGEGVGEAIEVAFELHSQAHTRVGTAELNDFLRKAIEQRGPGSKVGRRAKLFYASQIGEAPPTIALVVNDPDLFTQTDKRFLLNRIAEHTPFAETPVKLLLKQRARTDAKERIARRAADTSRY